MFFTLFLHQMSTIKTILYVQKTLKNQQHPVMLYLYEDKVYRISLGYSCTPKEWDETQGRFRKNVDNYKVKNLNLRKFELKASEICDNFVREGKRFDFVDFKNKFFGVRTAEKTFYEFFEDMIKEKKSLGKIGTMMAYKDAYSTLKKYKGGNVKFTEVNYAFLKGLETFLFQKGCTGGGIGARFRSIKAVFYEGIRRGLAKKELNPFSTTMNKDGYSLSKLKSEKNPRSLSVEDLKRIKNFDYSQYPELKKSYLYWMFSFRMFGMNFIDICTLTKENYQNGRIMYHRQKTSKPFNLKVPAEAESIINYFASESEYLFPIYNENIHKTPQQKKDRTMKVLKRTNKDIKKIANILGIETHLTFYVARHSSATTLKRNGISTDIISEALGHSNTQITQWYLKQFDNAVLDEAMARL